MTLTTAAPARQARQTDLPVHPPTTRFTNLRPQQALALPLLFTLALVAFGLLPSVREKTNLWWSFLGAGAVLFAWTAALLAVALRRGRTFVIDVVLRKQHYLQACAQGSVLLYWGWYWRPVYDSAALIAAQLVFAYAFDILLSWSRRDAYALGFGPFPVIFSINLFLWFKPDWFYLQFLLVAVGFAAKELIRWNKDGRQAHIFNPSSFPLGIFSIVLILTGTTSMTWGPEIAITQLLPPHIYLMLFLVGLPGQFFFGVTSMTMSAVVTTYAFGLLYLAATGTYFFLASYIPIAVFLGMHLLFTDPSTSPRTELGRVIFGMLYALSVIVLFGLLEATGVPSFYDKLLPVPLLNLAIKAIDHVARSNALKWLDPAALGKALAPRQRHLAYMSIWAVVFVIMSAAQGVGDTHRGNWVPFWQEACRRGLRNGCRNLALKEVKYCSSGSGWACNEFGILLAQGKLEGTGPIFSRAKSTGEAVSSDPTPSNFFQLACSLNFSPGCANFVAASGAGPLRSAPPGFADYLMVLNEGKGPIRDRTPLELYQRACKQGWMAGCESAAALYLRGGGTPRDPARAAYELDKACIGGEPTACSKVGLMYRNGDGVVRDETRAIAYLTKACDLGMENACRWVEDNRR